MAPDIFVVFPVMAVSCQSNTKQVVLVVTLLLTCVLVGIPAVLTGFCASSPVLPVLTTSPLPYQFPESSPNEVNLLSLSAQ